MREVQNTQMRLGEVDVSRINIDAKSRDDIPQLLRGLQQIYNDPVTREKLFVLLQSEIAPAVVKQTGRPGMTLWSMFVLGVVRLALNSDYDRLHELANQHNTLRQMLGHSLFDTNTYHHQTLKDNLRLFTPALLDQINQSIVACGHALVKKKPDEALRGRCDSFVVETDVHYPTDISLLFDATRKVILLSAELAAELGLSSWRQHRYNLRQLKRHLRSAQSTKHRKVRKEAEQDQADQRVKQAHEAYLAVAQAYLDKAQNTLDEVDPLNMVQTSAKTEIESFMRHAERQIDQTRRRVIDGEVIPHAEKVFSVFETHTEWISKGKAGVPVELGKRCCVLEDQHRFILHHLVMDKQTDDQVAVPIIKEATTRFPCLRLCSFDKGFHSPANQTTLANVLETVVLPRKGKRSQAAQAIEAAKDFVKARRQHSAVESAINALEVHGLDRCPDHGLDGFKRYIALAVVARNILRIGAIVKEIEQRQRMRKRSARASPDKLAA